MTDVGRVVALGASNLTRGFQTVVATARTAWGPDVEIVAALGHGRSYGGPSQFLVRRLPGILDSGLWRRLESSPVTPTRGLVTDVGNDIVYGFSADRILSWVDDALARLGGVSDDLVLTDLPMDSIRHLSPRKFRATRAMLFPSCRLSFAEVIDIAERVNAGLAELALARRARLLHLEPAWYGFDPVHIRPSRWQEAWQAILGVSCPVSRSRLETLRLYAKRPEQQWFCGLEQRTEQQGSRLPRGARVWLY